jgi:hypothetical protein
MEPQRPEIMLQFCKAMADDSRLKIVGLLSTAEHSVQQLADFQYSIEQRQLAPGEMMLAYTDGVTEAQDTSRTLYSGARLGGLLVSAPTTGAKAVVDFVRDDLRRFAAGAEQADDITMLAVRWIGRVSSI